MASSFTLNFDTTGPRIEIFAPSYTVRGMETEIIIQADEQLSQNHEIWVQDGQGGKFYLTLGLYGDKLVGTYNFNDFSQGVLTIFARVKDDVLNVSELVSKPINLFDCTYYVVEMFPAETRQGTLGCEVMEFELQGGSRSATTEAVTRGVELTVETRGMEVS